MWFVPNLQCSFKFFITFAGDQNPKNLIYNHFFKNIGVCAIGL